MSARAGLMIPTIEASPEEIYDIELEHSLLEANEKLARENRALLDRHGITAIDFMGAIGSGKTTLITRLVERLKDQIGIAVFNGDATTSDDADAIAKQNVPIVQIATVNGCHLDANLVGKALGKIELDDLRLICIENIGNLICPAEFPLGSKAPQGAGAIHSDLEHHFIRAETIRWDALLDAGSEAAARSRGTLRLEGKEYVVQDGDVMHIRHSG